MLFRENDMVDNKDDLDILTPQDPDTQSGLENIAQQVEDVMQQQALESADYFENGEDAIQEFMNSPEFQQVLTEGIIASVAKNNTVVKLNARDDMKRRARLASLIIARERNDPLFKKLALNRVKERALRKAIFTKYGRQAYTAAMISKKKHANEVKNQPALPKFQKDMTGAKTGFGTVFAGGPGAKVK